MTVFELGQGRLDALGHPPVSPEPKVGGLEVLEDEVGAPGHDSHVNAGRRSET